LSIEAWIGLPQALGNKGFIYAIERFVVKVQEATLLLSPGKQQSTGSNHIIAELIAGCMRDSLNISASRIWMLHNS
jgi:hypothetical protein